MTRRLLNKALICSLLLLLLSACQADINPTEESTIELQRATQTADAYQSNLAALAATASSISDPGVALIISTPTAAQTQQAQIEQSLSEILPTQSPLTPTEIPQPEITTAPAAPLLPAPVLNFANELCQAQWHTNLGTVDCPADSNSPNGFAVTLDKPQLETRTENEIALYTHPPLVPDSWISGIYPAFTAQPEDHFLADIGCLANFPDCKVEFTLEYQATGEAPVRLGQWQEQNDRQMTRVDIDLSGLSGQTIQLILTVRSKGDSGQAGAFWLVPQLRRNP